MAAHVTIDSLTTHPSNAQQARAFTSPASLSFPGVASDLTPPSSEKGANATIPVDGQNVNGVVVNGQLQGGNAAFGNGVTPATPAATPGASTPGSGIVPTLQWVYSLSLTYLVVQKNWTRCFLFSRNIVATVNLDCRLDLKTIALHARNAEYNPKVHSSPFLKSLSVQTWVKHSVTELFFYISVSLPLSCVFENRRRLPWFSRRARWWLPELSPKTIRN